MEYALIKAGTVKNVIVADEAFITQIAHEWDHIERIDTPAEQALGVGIGWGWNGTEFVAPPAPPAPPAPDYGTRLTKRAFQDRFPLTANGVSRKYDLMSMFMTDDGYAAALGVTGATLYELRSMIVTGLNRLNASSHVDFAFPDAANFTLLLLQPSIPDAFRLTTAERDKILNDPIQEGERWIG